MYTGYTATPVILVLLLRNRTLKQWVNNFCECVFLLENALRPWWCLHALPTESYDLIDYFTLLRSFAPNDLRISWNLIEIACVAKFRYHPYSSVNNDKYSCGMDRGI